MNFDKIKAAAKGCLLIGITGAPASGKSHLATELVANLGLQPLTGADIKIINLDNHFGSLHEVPFIIDGHIDNGHVVIVEGCALCELRDVTFDLLIEVTASDEVRYAVYASERTASKFGIASELYAVNQQAQYRFIKAHKKVAYNANSDRAQLPLPTQVITVSNFFEVAKKAEFAEHCEALLYGNVRHEHRLDLITDAVAFKVIEKGNLDSAKSLRATMRGLRIDSAATGKALKEQVDAVGKMLLDKTRCVAGLMKTAENTLSVNITAYEDNVKFAAAEKRLAKAQAQAEQVQRQKDCVLFNIPAEYWHLPANELEIKISIGKSLYEMEQKPKTEQAQADAAELAEFRRLKDKEQATIATPPPVTPFRSITNAPPTPTSEMITETNETYFCTFTAPQRAATEIRDFAAALGVVVCFE